MESSRKILIIDDDNDCRKLLLSWIASQFKGIEAVEYDPQSKGIPDKDFNWSAFDALLLDYDLRLEGVTGLDILQDNYNNPLFPPTVMLTGEGNEEVAVRALRSGVSDYLSKERLKKTELKAAIEKAFVQRASKRQHLYTLNEVMQVAKKESEKIIEAYKIRYEQEREQEVKSLKAEVQKIQQELIKNQAMLAMLEDEKKNAEGEKIKLLAEKNEQKIQQLAPPEAADIKKKLDTTQNELLQANTSIKSVKQSIKNANAAMKKTRWKQDQGVTEQQEVENELSMVLEDAQESSDAKIEMYKRLDTFFKRDTKETRSTEEEDQKLFNEITTQLDQ